jgi:hypothetical protein
VGRESGRRAKIKEVAAMNGRAKKRKEKMKKRGVL